MSSLRRTTTSLMTWLGTMEYVAWELFLGIYALLAVADVFYFSPATLRTLYVIGALVNGAFWLLVLFGVGGARRGGAFASFATQPGSLHFARTFGGHIVLATLMLVYMGKSADLTPLSFTTNLGTFVRFRNVHVVALLHFMVVTYGIVDDLRFNGIVDAMSRRSVK